jgi:hypothetical protein
MLCWSNIRHLFSHKASKVCIELASRTMFTSLVDEGIKEPLLE